MYKNLLAEIVRTGLNKEDIAKHLNISDKALKQKLTGEVEFKLNECLKIKSVLAENRLGLDYLFATKQDLN